MSARLFTRLFTLPPTGDRELRLDWCFLNSARYFDPCPALEAALVLLSVREPASSSFYISHRWSLLHQHTLFVSVDKAPETLVEDVNLDRPFRPL